MDFKGRLELSELQTKDTIPAGEYLFEAFMMEGRERANRTQRLMRMLDDGLVCYEVPRPMIQTDQP